MLGWRPISAQVSEDPNRQVQTMTQRADRPAAGVSVVVPNWNGLDFLADCVESLLAQSFPARVIVVDNGSIDGSVEFVCQRYPQVELIRHAENKGFAGGVNAGIRKAMADGDRYVALFNNDAVADKDWLANLVDELDAHPDAGIATSKFVSMDDGHFDSTGDMYTTWGIPFPRGRDEPIDHRFDDAVEVFGGSGGASLYRVAMLAEIGLFDEDFFAYYEDVDLSFRARLAGWRVRYVPAAVAHHHIGGTSSRIKGFTTYHSMKNLPWLLVKNAPDTVFSRILPRFVVAHTIFAIRAVFRGHGREVVRGYLAMFSLLPKKIVQRRQIQRARKATDAEIWAALSPGMTPSMRRTKQAVFARATHPLRAAKTPPAGAAQP